jgi:RNA polymerase sigma factor (sigma-70 family)
MDLATLIGRAQERDLDAFAEITRRFQHMAYGYALSILRDLGKAEDVVQESFVAAWFGLARLEDPAAFPGWLRGIVRHQAHRVLRRMHLEAALPLAEAYGLAAEAPEPEGRIERRRRADTVLAAITELPDPLREVVTLFYVHECSQQDIATFLGLPVTTVNNRLHAARAKLKRKVIAMVKDTLASHALPDDFAARIGRIVRAREGVIEARFAPEALPGVLTQLTVSDEARQRAITAQVVQRRPDGVVRAVSTGPADALSPGMAVLSERRPPRTPLGREGFARTVAILSGPPEKKHGGARLLETGIKVIDVMCPLSAGGTLAVAGEYRAGTVVVVEELVRRLCGGADRLSIALAGDRRRESRAHEPRAARGAGARSRHRARRRGGARARARPAAGAQASALLRPALLRRRAVYQAARRPRAASRGAARLPGDPRRRVRRRSGGGVLLHGDAGRRAPRLGRSASSRRRGDSRRNGRPLKSP